jgi:hypothetical protein
MSLKGNFCARISNRWKIVQNFVESGAQEAVIDLQPKFVIFLKIKANFIKKSWV